jgi:hypothetical protein
MGDGRGREVGVPVRYVRSISVPEEQTRVVFYQAPSRQAASETARLANLAVVFIAPRRPPRGRHKDVSVGTELPNSRVGGT